MSAAPENRRAAKLEEVEAAVRANDIARAMDLARAALDEGIEHPLVLNLRAYWHEHQGRDELALADLTRAVTLAPNDIAILNALGLAYARFGKMPEAVAAFGKLIALEPSFWHAHYNRGWTSEELGELDAARASYERAMTLAPDAPDPIAHLAALEARLGHWEIARQHAERALTLDPHQPVAIATLANVELAGNELVSAEKRARALLARSAKAPSIAANAFGILGDVLDAQDRTAEAFDAYSSANLVLRQIHQPKFEAPGVETVPQCLQWMTDFFRALEPSQWLKPQTAMSGGDEPATHIFILGFARSGTTLLEEILATHANAAATQERDALLSPVRDFFGQPADLERLAGLRGAALSRYRNSYYRQLHQFGIETNGKILIDKQPYNTIKLPLIAKLFPDARIIFSIRDPRDVILSCFRRRFRMTPSAYELLTLEGAARFYDATMHLAEIYREKLPLNLLAVRHDDLVEDFERVMTSVCNFAGVAWSEEMRNFASRKGARAVATPSAAQLPAGLNREGIGQWRRYSRQLTPVLPILQPWVERFGYSD